MAEGKIQLYARPMGSMQWLCPSCGTLYGSRRIDWRRARIYCTNNRCGRAVRIGVGFTRQLNRAALPPYNATYIEPYDNLTANRIDPQGASAIGTLIGPLDWLCPTCERPCASTLDRILNRVTCGCGQSWYVSLILWRNTNPNRHHRQPLDWCLPAYELPLLPQSVDTSQVGAV